MPHGGERYSRGHPIRHGVQVGRKMHGHPDLALLSMSRWSP
jgi:hypothetical protein